MIRVCVLLSDNASIGDGVNCKRNVEINEIRSYMDNISRNRGLSRDLHINVSHVQLSSAEIVHEKHEIKNEQIAHILSGHRGSHQERFGKNLHHEVDEFAAAHLGTQS